MCYKHSMRGYRGQHLAELKRVNCLFTLGMIGFFCCLQMIIQGAIREIPALLYSGIAVVAGFFIMIVIGGVMLHGVRKKIQEEVRANPGVMVGHGCNVTVTVSGYQPGAPLPTGGVVPPAQQNMGFVSGYPSTQQYPPQQQSGFAAPPPAYGTQPPAPQPAGMYPPPQPGAYPPTQSQFTMDYGNSTATAPPPPSYSSVTNPNFQTQYNPIKY